MSNDPAQIALRTYLLALSLSLGPSLVPALSTPTPGVTLNKFRLIRILRRELSLDGFAFAMTLAVGGGALLRKYLVSFARVKGPDLNPSRSVEEEEGDFDHPLGSSVFARLKQKFTSILNATRLLLACYYKLSEEQQTFLTYVLSSSLGVLVLQAGGERERNIARRRARTTTTLNEATTSSSTVPSSASPTLDLTLLLLVRAVDTVVQRFIIRRSSRSPIPGKELQQNITAVSNGQNSESTSLRYRSDLELEEKSKLDSKFRTCQSTRWTSRVDAFVFWACSARYVLKKNLN